MPTLDELHNAYMKSRDLENDYEAQKINDYYEWKPVADSIDDPEEIHWKPVAKKHIEENEDVDTLKDNNETDSCYTVIFVLFWHNLQCQIFCITYYEKLLC